MKLFPIVLGMVFVLLGKGAAQRLPTPQGIRVVLRTTSDLQINWQQPSTITYTSFSVQISPFVEMYPPETPDATSRTFTGLQPGISYNVVLIGETEDRRRSAPLRFPVWSKPVEPTNVNTKAIREVNIAIKFGTFETTYAAPVVGMHVDWEAPATPTGMTGYDVQISPKQGVMLFPQPTVEDDQDETSRIYTGLTPGQEYTVTIRTKTGPPYDPVFSDPIVMTRRIPPEKPFSVEPIDVGTTYATIKALGPIEGLHDRLYFNMTPGHGRVGPPTRDPVHNIFDIYTIVGLRPSTTYTLDVYAMSQSVIGWEPYTITFTTKPASPIPIRIIDFDSTTVTLEWDKPRTFTNQDLVNYIIQHVDVLSKDDLSVTTKVTSSDRKVRVTIRDLIPGTTYKFTLATQTADGATQPLAEAVQTTVPPLPVIGSMIRNGGGVIIVFDPPEVGNCPEVKVHTSPVTRGNDGTPSYHNIGQEIVLRDIPEDERHTIHSRCVSNNLEGPELSISTITLFDDEVLPLNAPRRSLPCIGRGGGKGKNPDNIAPNACCGDRPYNTINHNCCGTTLIRIGSVLLCCGSNVYSPNNSVCCSGGTVRPKEIGCPIA